MQIVATNQIFAETRALLAAHGTVIANTTPQPWPSHTLYAHARTADALVAFMTDRIDAALLAACPRLRIIGAALKGYDNIDIAAAEQAGVWVTIVPDLLTVPTAELAIGLMLTLGRELIEGDRRIRADGFHGWRPELYGRGIDGAHVGIVGFGRVGQAIAERLVGFRCRITAYDANRDAVPAHLQQHVHQSSLGELLQNADYIVLALPLTPATLHVIDAAAIASMKPEALLVNPARGSLVDERAVADALDTGHLGGYAADVFECEDWARADRLRHVEPRLLAPGAATVLTPHIGSAVARVRREIELSAAQSIIEVLSGQVPSAAVNRPPKPRGSANS
jgi:phosphonate dehydrogenase